MNRAYYLTFSLLTSHFHYDILYIPKYLESIAVSDPIHMMSMVDLVAINVETPMIDSGCSFEKEFNEFIHMDPCMM